MLQKPGEHITWCTAVHSVGHLFLSFITGYSFLSLPIRKDSVLPLQRGGRNSEGYRIEVNPPKVQQHQK